MLTHAYRVARHNISPPSTVIDAEHMTIKRGLTKTLENREVDRRYCLSKQRQKMKPQANPHLVIETKSPLAKG